MEQSFKQAVCDAFHGESDDAILERGFVGDLREVHEYALILADKLYETDYDVVEVYDFVYVWAKNDDIKFPWET